jgi:hypothetical protein
MAHPEREANEGREPPVRFTETDAQEVFREYRVAWGHLLAGRGTE